MANDKEIRTKIGSVKNTQKITRAMEMVAGSKMRKAQGQMEKTRPYAERIQAVVSHLANANPEYQHSYMKKRKVQRVGLIVISSDRGLCGGLNTNLFRKTLQEIQTYQQAKQEIDLCIIGRKAQQLFKRVGGNVVTETTQLGDSPKMADIIGSVSVMLEAYANQKIDKLVLVYNYFVNTMMQKPTVAQLLPLEASTEKELKHHWDYLYEPDAKVVVNELLTRYIESRVYQGVVENIACEQSARMVAMKSASDNAGDLITELQLDYNKARQAAITQEISEIVSGATAVG